MTRTRSLVAVAVLAVATAVGLYLWHGRGSAPTDTAGGATSEPAVSALVRVAKLEHRPLATTLTVFGEVSAGKVQAVNFARAGQVSSLLVVPGQHVVRGIPLAILVSDANAQMAYEQAVSGASLAENELHHQERLFQLQLATASQVDMAKKALADAQAALKAQRKIGGADAQSTVSAPFDGVVTAISVAQGDRIQPGAAILQLGRVDKLRILLGIEPEDRRSIRVGMPVSLSFVRRPGETVHGTIKEIDALVDPKTQLINAIVILPTEGNEVLVPGMRVRAEIVLKQQLAWIVPRDAVLSDDKGSYIFQVDQNVAHRVNVTSVVDGRDVVGVDGPVNPAAAVVISGNYELNDGMKVRESNP
jgi:membrane fusion protein (multidrug efflux system)